MSDFVDLINVAFDIDMWAIFWIVILKLIDGFLMVRKIKINSEAIKEELTEHLETNMHMVSEEVHNDVRYWFDADSDQFLAQGKDIDDIKEHLKQRYKDHIFVVDTKLIYAGPEYECKDVGSESAVIDYVTEYLLKKMGATTIDK